MVTLKRIMITLLTTCTISVYSEERPLNDPVLKFVDGKAGIFDGTKVKNTLWLMREIKSIHAGTIKQDAQGKPDPRNGTPMPLIFRGKKHTIRELMNLEKEFSSFSPKEQAEFRALFSAVKNYFGAVHNILIADARGAQQFMIKLIQEFCKKNRRTNSLLLTWNDKGEENEMYEHDVVDFTIFYVFSMDLLNFLGALLKSCPKALAQATANRS